ncbi:family 78 glycoside hydrolase catalytic domain [Mediterraneibacter sp. NSJ-55]|uniref:alpha-L-rhamnosidase n=1 Tax=Mediterraneibacter hominis TaxID=2763054 RepID=A0A923LKJ4_9FIRM|nr:alpha-L-rhamnosidase [Mediterraneibacter hominis]MBC5690416.1 family 78 glycoside hydrolase catalytic domain [Mediterraneibacter hominis]
MRLENLTVEHQREPLGIDVKTPRFAWVIVSDEENVLQRAYQIEVFVEGVCICNTGRIETDQSIEVTVDALCLRPKTRYDVKVVVWDNKGNTAKGNTVFETGLLEEKWKAGWIEPNQIPTEPTTDFDTVSEFKIVTESNPDRDFKEFQPVKYIRIPTTVKEKVKRARVYMTAHGVYRLEVNGARPDNREFAPENSAYEKVLYYQTYDVTEQLFTGENIFGVMLADGWWSGRVGASGDSCQYGDKVGLLFQAEITYENGEVQTITAENALSSTGPLVFSDIFVGEKYDAGKEMDGWNRPGFDDSTWEKVNPADYTTENVAGQYGEPVRPIQVLKPERILRTPKGEMVVDLGQVIAGQMEFTVTCEAGRVIRLEHSEVLDKDGNYYNNILGINKEQTDFYITKKGQQTYKPYFTYHGFRYVKVSGWPGEPKAEDFKAYVLTSEMQDIGNFETSDERINRLQKNIWWSQIANTLSIPTDCPQRERAGWTGDIMAYAPTMVFLRQSNAFLTRWMQSLRADQLEDGQVPSVVPYLKAYKAVQNLFGTNSSCGWGDAVLRVPLAVYQAYGDRKILEENYDAMKKWLAYIQRTAENQHPEEYDTWDETHKERSRYLWNTGFHFGDWLVPSMVLNNPDGGAMIETAFKTKKVVAPAYYAYSTSLMAEMAEILGKEQDKKYFETLNRKIRKAFIEEYVHEDGTIEEDLQGLYVIALKNGLVTEKIRPKMAAHLRKMIAENRGCLDTGFLSILFLMDVLCENDMRDVAYSLLYQNKCPSWLYEVEKGATTMWESWGAISEDGTVSTYSYNHYAFGCVGEWLYREIGGINMEAPGYKKIKISPHMDCGLTSAQTSFYSPYGLISVKWEITSTGSKNVQVQIPVNTTADIAIEGMEAKTVGSGSYSFIIQ